MRSAPLWLSALGIGLWLSASLASADRKASRERLAGAESRAPRPSGLPTRHLIRMQAGGFSPRELTISAGDTVRFVLGSGGPHNVAFRETKGAAAARLRARMGKDTISDLAGPLLILPGDTYDIVFDAPAGKYPYWCIPHLAMGQMGSITVR